MEIKIGTSQILKVLYVLSWIIFTGLCIQAGGIFFNTFFTLVYKPEGARHFWQEIDLSAIYRYDSGHFTAVAVLICIVAVLKAILFYLILKLLHDKKLDLSQPFNLAVKRFILNVSYLTLGIGLFSFWGANYSQWLVKQGVMLPDPGKLLIGGADVWLFMSVTLFVIAQIFKKGIEIQTENELTV